MFIFKCVCWHEVSIYTKWSVFSFSLRHVHISYFPHVLSLHAALHVIDFINVFVKMSYFLRHLTLGSRIPDSLPLTSVPDIWLCLYFCFVILVFLIKEKMEKEKKSADFGFLPDERIWYFDLSRFIIKEKRNYTMCVLRDHSYL
jgi:hypothetical protein